MSKRQTTESLLCPPLDYQSGTLYTLHHLQHMFILSLPLQSVCLLTLTHACKPGARGTPVLHDAGKLDGGFTGNVLDGTIGPEFC
jgi:hypothetical protein|mmetsp:Transcript_109672/g.186514  ORF Transcript_109672/g.186514 Transcript_109672/m.186514 type:complete len:85 (+) Transcript_109672:1403-1657(+)